MSFAVSCLELKNKIPLLNPDKKNQDRYSLYFSNSLRAVAKAVITIFAFSIASMIGTVYNGIKVVDNCVTAGSNLAKSQEQCEKDWQALIIDAQLAALSASVILLTSAFFALSSVMYSNAFTSSYALAGHGPEPFILAFSYLFKGFACLAAIIPTTCALSSETSFIQSITNAAKAREQQRVS